MVYRASASHHARLDPARYAVPARAEVVGHYEALRLDGDHVLFVAEIDGVVVGFVELEWLRPPPVWSMLRNGRRAHLDIAIAEEFRARGIGSRLLEAAESWARRGGAEALVLDALTANGRALAFYEKAGFAAFGTVMEKPLASV